MFGCPVHLYPSHLAASTGKVQKLSDIENPSPFPANSATARCSRIALQSASLPGVERS
ncbi:hypothetical protein AVDCRST_MAG94-3986 [uncultured Leptolyngbya sp.]|uniref:Uncharacterized protein n=1 Tax=uncultured Leptolyngbya sp. TaxID=332963 RepID=A0A6J4MVY6_9CYAN|nr:hypothetical protein AVDCRST_MAG94-3986 [uncultured Leptolyngbya sp.]